MSKINKILILPVRGQAGGNAAETHPIELPIVKNGVSQNPII
jgi:hypothetical protein